MWPSYFFNLRDFSWHSIEQKPVFLKNFLASLVWVLGGLPQNLHFIFNHLCQIYDEKRLFKETLLNRYNDFSRAGQFQHNLLQDIVICLWQPFTSERNPKPKPTTKHNKQNKPQEVVVHSKPIYNNN